jgi:hypothetical protein
MVWLVKNFTVQSCCSVTVRILCEHGICSTGIRLVENYGASARMSCMLLASEQLLYFSNSVSKISWHVEEEIIMWCTSNCMHLNILPKLCAV